MIIKSIVLAVILLLGSLGIAAAQSSEPHGTLGHGEPSEDKPVTQAVVIGYNFFHASLCVTRPGAFFWISQEDGSTWVTTDVATIAMLTPSCQTGNFVGFHVINLSLMLFDQVLVFPFK